jgi:Mrp family chromosome partitioning ATPase/capsular polysaccharide biosynthesis protein
VHDLGLRDYLQILRRRKWIVVAALVIVPLAAVSLSLRESPVYQSSSDVLLRFQSLPSTLSGISDPNSYAYYIDPTRATDTSLQVAGLPALQNRVASALRRRGVSTADVGSTFAAQVGDTDVLRFTSETGDAATAAATATEYAQQFTSYYQQLDTQSIRDAITGLQSRIVALQAQGGTQARTEATSLRSKVSQLQTLQTLQTATAIVIRTASGAAKIKPTPRKYAMLGIALGLVLGIGLAFLRDAFDTRLRTSGQISDLLKLSLLARLPAPARRLEKESQLVMIAEPTSTGADAFRRLRMNLEFAAIGKPSQVTMVTSAMPQEGKSTTIANLAVAMALAGKTVALVDLDLHRPTLSRFFRVVGPQREGLSGVVLGLTDLEDALVPVPLETQVTDLSPRVDASQNGHGRRNPAGSLYLLPPGPLPPDPGEFVGLEGVRHVIAGLRERVDVVLIDAPPVLAVGDGLTIAGFSDAVIVVVRSELARRPIQGELAATLARLPVVKLGYVLLGEQGFDGPLQYGYAYGYGVESKHEERVG